MGRYSKQTKMQVRFFRILLASGFTDVTQQLYADSIFYHKIRLYNSIFYHKICLYNSIFCHKTPLYNSIF